MNKIELVRTAVAWDLANWDSYYTKDFQYTDALGSPPMDRDAFLAMGRLIQSALPDLKTVIKDIREEGDEVLLTSHWEGTFVNDFDLSAVGMGVIPATGKKVVLPGSTIRVGFSGSKISKIHDPKTGPDAGIPGLVKALSANGG